MTKRLGRVLYWAGILIGALFGAVIFRVAQTEGVPGQGAIFGAIVFAVPFLIGLAARYVLAGK